MSPAGCLGSAKWERVGAGTRFSVRGLCGAGARPEGRAKEARKAPLRCSRRLSPQPRQQSLRSKLQRSRRQCRLAVGICALAVSRRTWGPRVEMHPGQAAVLEQEITAPTTAIERARAARNTARRAHNLVPFAGEVALDWCCSIMARV